MAVVPLVVSLLSLRSGLSCFAWPVDGYFVLGSGSLIGGFMCLLVRCGASCLSPLVLSLPCCSASATFSLGSFFFPVFGWMVGPFL